MRHRYLLLCAIVICLLPLYGMAASSNTSLVFTKNMGQWPDSILFRASAGVTTMWFTPDGIWYQFISRIPRPHSSESWNPSSLARLNGERDSIETAMVKAQFVGADPHAEIVGLNEQAYICNYFLGSDPDKWRSNVPTYSAITYKDLLPGVEATFRSDNGQLTYELHGPADALAKVQAAYFGGTVTQANDGSAIVQTKLGEKRFSGMLPVTDAATIQSYLTPASANGITLVYSTYLGGNDNDYAVGVAVDTAGCAYVSGLTYSANFPTQSPQQPYQGAEGYSDTYVTKLSATGNSAIYSTYVGGSRDDVSWTVAVDDQSYVYLSGKTYSTDFPTHLAYQVSNAGSFDAFVTRLSPNGDSLTYSTYLGGSEDDEAFGLALDQQRNVYVTGHTSSADFPTKTPYQTDPGDANWDAFVTKLPASGDSLIYSTYLAGSSYDDAFAIAVDDSGCAYVTGSTNSSNFPTNTPYQTHQAGRDVFVTKLTAAGNNLVYSTYLGGSNYEYGYGIAVDGSGHAYVTGGTLSSNFPTKTPYQTSPAGAFVTKFSPTGNGLVYSTYLGEYGDEGHGIALDDAGNAYLTGQTSSSHFPTQSPYQTDQPYDDAFVTKLSASGAGLISSTYLGGRDNDYGRAIALDRSGFVYVAGYTASDNFPTQTPYQSYQGPSLHYDGFVTKLALKCCVGTTGNVDASGAIDLSDLSWLITYLTVLPTPAIPCPEAGNVNATGIIDLGDLSYLITYLTVVPKLTLPPCP